MTYGTVTFAAGPYAGPEAAAPTIAAGATPVVSVEVAFASDPLDEVPLWVQVPHRRGDIGTGRKSEIGRFSAGRATIVIPNQTRTYDPNNASSAYYGQMRPMKQLRVQATWGGVTYPLFTGYVDSWNAQRTNPSDAVVVVTASDAFKPLARSLLQSGAYAQEVAADNPAHWYRLDEPTGAATLYDSIGDRDLVAQGTLAQTTSLLARDANAATLVDAISDGGISPLRIKTAGVTAFTVELVFSTSAGGAGQTCAAEVDDTVSRGWSLGVDTGQVEVFIVTSSGSVSFLSPGVISNGVAHHLALRWNGATAWLYIDGVEVNSASIPGTLFPTGMSTYIVMAGAAAGPIVNTATLGTYDELALYDTDIGAARIAAHAAQVATPWNSDTPAQRMARILDAAAFPRALRELDTGSSVLQSATLGDSVLEHAQKVADSDFGELLITPTGTVKLIGRAGLINRASQATFADDGVSLRFADIAGKFDDTELFNDATVSRNDGVAQRYDDATSVGDYGRQSLSKTGLIHNSDAVSLAAAQFYVNEYKTPLDRIVGLTVKPYRDPTTLFPQVLGRELLEVITVQQTPQHVGSVDSRTARIEGISHSWEPGRNWETTWDLSPALTGAYGAWDISNWDSGRWFF